MEYFVLNIGTEGALYSGSCFALFCFVFLFLFYTGENIEQGLSQRTLSLFLESINLKKPHDRLLY